MHMPQMDGVALAGRIRALRPALPRVLFSSLGRKEGGEPEGLFAAHLAKPLRQSQLFDTLVGLLAPVLRSRPRGHWLSALEAAKVPCGPINTVPDVFADAQVQHRDMLRLLPHPELNQLQIFDYSLV